MRRKFDSHTPRMWHSKMEDSSRAHRCRLSTSNHSRRTIHQERPVFKLAAGVSRIPTALERRCSTPLQTTDSDGVTRRAASGTITHSFTWFASGLEDLRRLSSPSPGRKKEAELKQFNFIHFHEEDPIKRVKSSETPTFFFFNSLFAFREGKMREIFPVDSSSAKNFEGDANFSPTALNPPRSEHAKIALRKLYVRRTWWLDNGGQVDGGKISGKMRWRTENLAILRGRQTPRMTPRGADPVRNRTSRSHCSRY